MTGRVLIGMRRLQWLKINEVLMRRLMLAILLFSQVLWAQELAPPAKVGQPFNYTAKASQGATACTLQPKGSPGVVNGLPDGLSFTQPGTFLGTPSKAGIYEVTLVCKRAQRSTTNIVRIRVVKNQ